MLRWGLGHNRSKGSDLSQVTIVPKRASISVTDHPNPAPPYKLGAMSIHNIS